MSNLIALDPGGTTGVALYDGLGPIPSKGYEHRFRTLQIEGENHHLPLWKLLTRTSPQVVICERFDSMPMQAMRTINLDAREYIGVAKLYTQMLGRKFVPQQRSAAKGQWPDDKIKDLHLWQPNAPHAMDALRHLLYYLTQSGEYGLIRILRDVRR